MSFPADIPVGRKGNCYRCGEEGHWAADCSQSRCFSQPNPGRVSSDGGAGNGSPGIICKCGVGVCQPRVAKDSGKVYYRCPAESWMSCGFFMWQSSLKSGSVKQLQYPICSCGAGVCVLDYYPGNGREYFKCRVPEGQGACSFRQWVNTRVSRSTTKSMDIETSAPRSLGKQANHPLSDEDDSPRKCLKLTELERSPKTNSDRFSSNSAASLVCSDTKEGSVASSMYLEDLSPELLREMMQCEYLLFGDDNDKQLMIMELEESPDNSCGQLSSNSVISLASSSGKDVSMLNAVDSEQFETDVDLISEVIVSESTVSHVDGPGEVSNDSQMEEVVETTRAKHQDSIRLRQANFCRMMVAAAADTDHPEEKTISLILGAQYLGWLCRLAFGSPRFLMLPLPKNWFFCIFPNFDPIVVPSSLDQFNDKAQSVSTVDKSLTLPKQSVVKDPPAVILKEPSAHLSPPYVAEPDNVTAAAIMKAFGQAAMLIQSNFLTRLESMDPSCHEAMVKEANTAFASLDHLKVDCRPFYRQVKDFIDAAATLTQIEHSMCNDVSFHDYLDRCNRENLRLEQLVSEHDSVMNSITRSQAHLQTLQNEAEEVRNRLLQIENQVSACNLEITDLQNHVAELSGQINKCEDSLQSAYREAEAAKKISIQREVELSAAWDVFETAKLQLRNKAS